MGHAVYMQNAIEENNLIESNLVTTVKRAYSLL